MDRKRIHTIGDDKLIAGIDNGRCNDREVLEIVRTGIRVIQIIRRDAIVIQVDPQAAVRLYIITKNGVARGARVGNTHAAGNVETDQVAGACDVATDDVAGSGRAYKNATVPVGQPGGSVEVHADDISMYRVGRCASASNLYPIGTIARDEDN